MKKTMSVVFCIMLALTAVLAGCSSSNNNKPENQATGTGGASTAPSDTGEASHAPAVPEKYDPPITLTTASTVLAEKLPEGDSVDNNAWTRLYEQKYGIKIKTEFQADGATMPQRMNLAITSGDIPDFFQVPPAQFKQLVEADMVEDLTDVFNNYASERVKNVINEGGPQALKSATVDGKLMAIPYTSLPKEGVPILYVRSDWLKKLNLPEPKTMADVLAISTAFTEQDPDGNGKPDTYGLAMDKDYAYLKGFLNGFHAYQDIWIKDSEGKLQYSSIQPEMKTALQQLQNLFKGKQIDPEFGTKGFDKVLESLNTSKIGMFYFPFFAGLYPLQAGITKDPTMEWKPYPIVSVDDKPALNQLNLNVDTYWVVKKGVEHPEAILKMLDSFVEIFYENTDPDINTEFVNDGNSQIWAYANVQAYRAFKNINQRLKVNKSLETKDTSELTGDDKNVYDNVVKYLDGDINFWGWNFIYGPEGSLGVVSGYVERDQYMQNEFITSSLPIMTEKNAALLKLQNEMITKIILGASMDEFDKFVANWKKLGGDEITKEVNEWYAANN